MLVSRLGRRAKVVRLVVFAGVLMTGACGGKDVGMQPTITIDEANRRVEQYSTQVREALPAEAVYELSAYEDRGDCSDPTDRGPKNRVVASRTYQIQGLPAANVPSYFGAVRTWWQDHGFRILDDNPPNEFLWGENTADGFQMTLKSNFKGELFLIVSSPCVWPGGTPEPPT
ncbi:hypothetical protein GCM10023214_75090 [Amycolatopsis dongchuanensis]|uniref:Lipoprotein n=1 Tax=Amycolatopsis dongchuanensis TaxID=1070866 RepID=A0ABP8VQY5_9PSEU